MPRVVVFFHNSALGNLAIQLLMQIGVPNDRLGVTPPEQIEGGQGMILSIAAPTRNLLARVESICRLQGGRDPPPARVDRRPPAILRSSTMTITSRIARLAAAGSSSQRSRASRAWPLIDPAQPRSPRSPGTCPTHSHGRADLPVQRQGLDRILHVSARPASTTIPRRSSRVQDGMIQISGEEFGGLTTQRRVSRLSPGRRSGSGASEPLGRGSGTRATRASCSTASAPTAPPAATGWSRRSARSSKGAAATSSWSAASGTSRA